jgi:hypothetical protein
MIKAQRAIRYKSDGFHPSHAFLTGFACLVGTEDLVIHERLTRAPTKQRSNSLTFVGGSPDFSARAELDRLLNTAPVYTPDQLTAAQEAVGRLTARPSESEIDALAHKLAADFVVHED